MAAEELDCRGGCGAVYSKPAVTGEEVELSFSYYQEKLAEHLIEVKYIDRVRGKGVFAKQAVEQGKVILRERSLAVSQYLWNKVCKYEACDNCMYPLETAQQTAIRLSGGRPFALSFQLECCPNSTGRTSLFVECECCGERYCSFQCKEEASVYHSYLCVPRELRRINDPARHPVLLLEKLWRELHYPPESASILLLVKMLARAISQAEKGVSQQEALKELTRFTSLEVRMSGVGLLQSGCWLVC
mmetsp:Transcript_41295/g.106857  ORF Transcript_41295/g.106857 Transcript_41295/m.106857 type:complete len:245 (+) Transcript_41295:160-894(+)